MRNFQGVGVCISNQPMLTMLILEITSNQMKKMQVNRQGYLAQGGQYKHRQVADAWWLRHFGTHLPKSLVVHHINGDKTDNRVENFAFLTRSQHMTLHAIISGKSVGTASVKHNPELRRAYGRAYTAAHKERMRELKRNWMRRYRNGNTKGVVA